MRKRESEIQLNSVQRFRIPNLWNSIFNGIQGTTSFCKASSEFLTCQYLKDEYRISWQYYPQLVQKIFEGASLSLFLSHAIQNLTESLCTLVPKCFHPISKLVTLNLRVHSRIFFQEFHSPFNYHTRAIIIELLLMVDVRLPGKLAHREALDTFKPLHGLYFINCIKEKMFTFLIVSPHPFPKCFFCINYQFLAYYFASI